MQRHITLLAAIAALLFTFAACGNETADTTRPTINLIEPEEEAELLIGSPRGVHFEMELADDHMLASYKIEIHSNFDNHSHHLISFAAPAAEDGEEEATVDFSFNRSYDLTGLRNTSIHHHDILIPANATPGRYHLLVYCVDAAGNEAHTARNIILSTTAPEDEDED